MNTKKITIFGLAGTGTSTVGKQLAKELGYEFMSTGNIFRETAKELGLDIYEFDKLARSDSKYDIELDKKVDEYGKKNTNFVFESRLAWHFIPDSFKVKIYCDFDTRVQRVASRDNASFEEVKEKTIQREIDLLHRFEAYYNIKDIDSDANFDLVINSTFNDVDNIVEQIRKSIV